ncbi:Disease resistance protein [Senna tora]|uniref:Disease resistance protein n=1 Tax=Senna tora TaxID=362788 RepID=A0A834WVD8_9FABA|nr:Disease resistance protein [Senna tora]
MEEIATSATANIVSQLVCGAVTEANYCFHFNRYVKGLETQKEKLQSKIESVLDRAKEDRKNTKIIVKRVDEWLSEANSLISKVVKLEEKAKHKRMNTSCLNYCPPNLIRRYSLGKKLKEMAKQLDEHTKIEFSEGFSRVASLVGINYYSSDGFLQFDSRKEAYGRLLEALKDDKTHMIGLYGMGGCGKTTLAKEVGKEAQQHFGKVVLVTVSNDIKVDKIQESIASQLGLKLEEKEEPERAKRLFMRLTNGERLLLILDDVWVQLNFEAIGIPTGENQKGCTILITTRQYGVCTSMNCGRTIFLKVLNEEEAWALFQKHAQFSVDNSDSIKSVAEEITKQCGGLLVAIAAVASTLKGKEPFEWEEALKTLKDSNLLEIEEGLQSPYACLELSYNKLKNEEARSLFLLCSVFPEDYEISLDLLTMIGIGLGLVEEFQSYTRARNIVRKAKNKLTDSCLLLEVEEEVNEVKMHDLVRDVAQWIAKKEGKLIMGPEKSHKVLKDDLIIKDAKIRYLWLDEVDKFPHELDCPELEFLYVSTRSQHDVDVTNEFFKGLKKLRVLYLKNLSGNVILRLSNSAHLINNLCCLILYGWSLGDISIIGSLEKLVSLRLWYCSFDELPNGIILQKKLRLLELRNCEINKNPYEVIGRCSQLEELYFFGNRGKDWEYQEGQNVAEYFDKVRITPALERYCIDLGKCYYDRDVEDFPKTRSSHIEDFDACVSNATIKDLMQRAEFLSLGGVNKSCKYIFPDIVESIGGGLNALTRLTLCNSKNIECMIDNASHLSLLGTISNLTHLEIRSMRHLKTLYYGQPPEGLFAKLEVLEIYGCDSLVHIITDEEAKEIVVDSTIAFSKLKTLFIRSCNQDLTKMMVTHLENLKTVSLHNVKTDVIFSLEWLSINGIVVNLGLQDISLVNLPELRHIWMGPKDIIGLQNLVELDIQQCVHLKVIFPASILRSMPQLTMLSINNCEELEEIIEEEGNQNVSNPQLLFPHLTTIIIKYCHKLKRLFSVSTSHVLPILETMWIEEASQLEQVFGDEEEDTRDMIRKEALKMTPQLKFLALVKLPSLTNRGHWILELQTVRYRVVHKSPKLNLTSTHNAADLHKLRAEMKGSYAKECLVTFPFDSYYVFINFYKQLLNERSTSEPSLTKQQAFGESEITNNEICQGNKDLENERSENETNLKDQKQPLGEYEIPQQIKRVKQSEEEIQSAQEENISETEKTELVNKRSTSEPRLTEQSPLGESEVTNKEMPQGAKSDKELEDEDQSVKERNILEKTSVKQSEDENPSAKGSIEESSTLENAKIVISSAHSKPESSLEACPLASFPSKAFLHELANERSANEPSLMDQKQLQQPIGEYEIPQQIKRVKQSEDKIQSAQEENISETEKTNVKGNIDDCSTMENAKAVISPPKAFLHSQINIKQTETDIDKVTEPNPIINLQDFEDDDDGQIQISAVSSIRNDFVEKALSDLEVSLKLPLKDIAISEANTLHILTLLNFLSCLSFEDGALLPQGLNAIIKSLHQELPSILYSFKPALAMINKFHEAQEKEARLKEQISMWEKEIKETTELKKEYESVMKENVEMLEDQTKAWQQLFEVDYKWSVLHSQFQQKSIDVHTRRIIHSTFENVTETNEDSEFQNLTETLNETTLGLGIPRTMETSRETEFVDRRSANNEISQGTKSDDKLEDEDQSAKEGNISEETSIVKGNIEGGSTSKNAEAFPHSQLNINLSVPIVATTKDELVAKAISDMEVSMKMPLKDIATSKANSLRLLTALNFLSCLSSDDGALPHGLKAVIDSLHQDFPSILCSFKSAFAKINKFPKFEEHISKLEKEIKECDKKLSSVEAKKKKYVAETIELKKVFESVGKDKSEMEKHQRKAQQQILQDNYRWSFLCSQFQLNNIDARNLG